MSTGHRIIPAAVSLAAAVVGANVPAQADPGVTAKPYHVEWVYRIRYGYRDEWWQIFRKYQIAALDEEKRRGYVLDYRVIRPGLHTSEDSRWDYRIEITYNGYDGATHEAEVEKTLFPDTAALQHDENRRWELTTNHWDLPIHDIDPHASN